MNWQNVADTTFKVVQVHLQQVIGIRTTALPPQKHLTISVEQNYDQSKITWILLTLFEGRKTKTHPNIIYQYF